ncbi:hypothetical protein Tco_0691392 [Tanacetum coccineum]
MKRGFRGTPRPLLPAMLLVTTNPNACQEHDAVAQSQPSSSTLPVPSTSSPPVQSPPPASIPTPTPIPETEPEPFELYFETTPIHQHFSPPQEQAQGQMTVDDLLQVVPQLISRIDSLETDLKQTKLTMGNAIVKLIRKNLNRKNLRPQRRIVKMDPLRFFGTRAGYSFYDKSKCFRGGTSGRHKNKVNTVEGVNTGSIKLSTVSEQVSTGSTKMSTPSSDKGQRARKAPMIIEETPKKSKEQISQEEASLAEAIRLDSLQKEEKKRKAQVQFEAQHYTDEDWDLIRAKIEANAELSKTKKSGKRRKQMARRGLHTDLDKDDSKGSDEVSEQDDSVTCTKIPINPVPVAMKSPSIVTYKIIKQGEKGVSQIVREDGTDIVYINFGAMLKDISKDDLTELYRIVMNRYGMDGPEDGLEKVFWKHLKNMFKEPLSTDPIWSALGQQRIISWRYYDSCRVHCLNLESMDIYMLIERKYPLSAEICKIMLNKKLRGGKPDKDCYKMLKMMEKQAGIRKY